MKNANSSTTQIMGEIKKAGYDVACAFATGEEIAAGAACGQLAMITDEEYEKQLAAQKALFPQG